MKLNTKQKLAVSFVTVRHCLKIYRNTYRGIKKPEQINIRIVAINDKNNKHTDKIKYDLFLFINLSQ